MMSRIDRQQQASGALPAVIAALRGAASTIFGFPMPLSLARWLLFASSTPLAATCIQIDAVAVAAPAPALQFVVENRCAASLPWTPAFLPWGSSMSLTLTAVAQTDPAELLPRRAPLYHDDHERVEIRPGQRLEGEVGLTAWFGDFDAVNRRAPILVHWVYRLPDTLGGEVKSGEVRFAQVKAKP